MNVHALTGTLEMEHCVLVGEICVQTVFSQKLHACCQYSLHACQGYSVVECNA